MIEKKDPKWLPYVIIFAFLLIIVALVWDIILYAKNQDVAHKMWATYWPPLVPLAFGFAILMWLKKRYE